MATDEGLERYVPGDAMTNYPLPCPHCGHVIDSMDSMSDTRAALDDHLLAQHPDLPDPTFDPRFQETP